MPIEVRLFGDLRTKGQRLDESGYVGVIDISENDVGTVRDIMSMFGLEELDVSHIFINFNYSEIDAPVKAGDRVGIFPRDMALLYRWYFEGGLNRTYASGKISRD